MPSKPTNGKTPLFENAKFKGDNSGSRRFPSFIAHRGQTGSDLRIRHDGKDEAHIALAFEIGGFTDPDSYPLMVGCLTVALSCA